MTNKAWLEGHQFDLEDLAEQLAAGDVRVVRDETENAYYLTSPEIDNPPEAGQFDKPAKSLIVRINGLGRAKSADFRPVKLSGKYTDSNGNAHLFVSPAPAELRIRGSAAGFVLGPHGQPEPDPPSPWPARFALAGTNSDVAEALEFMGATEPLGWVDLRKVYEIINDSIPRKIYKMGWTTRARLSAFTGSADRPDVSGREARHARLPGLPPRHTMTLAEGRSYVSDLVTKWLAWLAGN
ncbi:MAG: hypothetical protein ACLP75_07055 [Mycobacterium sp.]|jgi:hypothetical protein|uniref:hypothetical protein n=1 Tax=Mycobacterium sp. TaxID=1785 RepID=UPI00284D9F31|nr:hypothetical protein [Mycobacterium sp.]